MEVDSNRILQPLGVYVLRDSRYDLLPGTRDYTEEIPGRDGEIDFGSEFGSRILELHCVCLVEPDSRAAKMREIANYLNPTFGTQTLTFADEPGKVYHVKYAGNIDVNLGPHGFEFTIPFKMCNPFITSAELRQLIGSGTATNAGTVPTPFMVTMQGAVTNPSVTVRTETMQYTGTVQAGSVLVIDTEKMTVTLDGLNALTNYNGVFPKLVPGDNTVTVPVDGTTTLRWLDRWI